MPIIIDKQVEDKQIIRCCERCYFAREKKCKCRCGGLYHGKGLDLKKGEQEKTERQEELF